MYFVGGEELADDKKYYYLKLKENFFDGEQMIILESMQDGHLYSNILLKLYLRSLKNEGKLMFNDRIPYTSTILSQIVRHPVGVVEKAIHLFKEFGLIDVMDNGAIYMLDIQNYIGKSSTEADRQRDYQHRISQEKGLLLPEKCKKSNEKSNVESNEKPNRKSTPELELDIELKKEKELKKEDNNYIVFFEEAWQLYPEKKGKGKISDSKKKELYKIGEELKRCIERYVKDTDRRRKTFPDLKFQNGSTFFNTGYIDFLDSNVKEVIKEKPKFRPGGFEEWKPGT